MDKTRVRALIQDALDAAEKDVDPSAYSFVALLLGVRRDEYGMGGLCGWPGMLGWRAGDAPRTRGGRSVGGGVAIFCREAHLGTLFHDVAHILGGTKEGKRRVPCLYDHDIRAKSGPARESQLAAAIHLECWDPMSCHFWRWPQPPPGIGAWTRMRLGWFDAAKVKVVAPGSTEEIRLGPLNDPAS